MAVSLPPSTPLEFLTEYVHVHRVGRPKFACFRARSDYVSTIELSDGRKFSSPPLADKKEAEETAAALCLHHLFGFNKFFISSSSTTSLDSSLRRNGSSNNRSGGGGTRSDSGTRDDRSSSSRRSSSNGGTLVIRLVDNTKMVQRVNHEISEEVPSFPETSSSSSSRRHKESSDDYNSNSDHIKKIYRRSSSSGSSSGSSSSGGGSSSSSSSGSGSSGSGSSGSGSSSGSSGSSSSSSGSSGSSSGDRESSSANSVKGSNKRPREFVDLAQERKNVFLKECEVLFQQEEWKGEKLFRKIDRASVSLLPQLIFTGRIHNVNTQRQLDDACDVLRDEPVLGLDTESRPSFKKGETFPVTLLQLATENAAYLIELSAFTDPRGRVVIPPRLCDLLSDSNVLKVGAGISDDVLKLLELRHNNLLRPQGIIDLVGLARRCGIQEFGLRGLCALLLGQKLSKTEQLSRWDRFPLTEKQQHYAACDAWMGYRLYQELRMRDIDALELAHIERLKRRTEALDQFVSAGSKL